MITRTNPASTAGTLAAAFLFLWAAYGLAQQDSELVRQCQARGAAIAECQLRIRGR
jgi:hypothetical protein